MFLVDMSSVEDNIFLLIVKMPGISCPYGSSGSGALTQLIAQGALDQYLSANASFTFWKVRYNKHTNFAMEAIAQPFNTSVSFGGESQITLNRNGDLIYFMYVVIDLPGITACVSEGDNCMPGMGSGQFPAASNPCNPCEMADKEAYASFLSNDPSMETFDGHSCADAYNAGADMPVNSQCFAAAKARWARANYGSCAPLACCEPASDCPWDCCHDLEPNPENADCNALGGNKPCNSGGCGGLAGPSCPVWCHWTNAIGQFLIRCARIVIGGSTIDTLYNDFLFMWEELTGKSGKRLCEMIGKRYTRTQLICDSRHNRQLWTPLPFWFTMHSGQALALASLQFHGVMISVEFESLSKCVIVSNKDVRVTNCKTGCCLTPNDLSAYLETTYIYLDTVERDRFATTHYEVLIVQNQAYVQQTANSQVRMQLNFNHPCSEIIFAVRRKCQESANNWFNFSGHDNRDPVVSAALFLNNQARFSNKPGAWFRLVQPYQYHTNVPDAFVYCYSFALHPEDSSPSGSCNFSRIDHVDLTLQLQDSIGSEQVTIMVFARNWNVLRFREGLAGIAYTN